jgi:heme-degrading monooxygenase HmoA
MRNFPMHLALSHVLVASAAIDEYVEARQMHINPALGEQPGYEGSILLRPRDDAEPVRLALLNVWTGPEYQRRWAESPRCAELMRSVDHIVRRLEHRCYQRIEDASIVVGDQHKIAMCSIGVDDVLPGHSESYLRRWRDVANPSLSQAPGFVGVSVFTNPDEPDRFLSFLRWEGDDAADQYYATSERNDVVHNAFREVLTREPLRSPRYDALLRHVPDAA